MKGFSPRNLGYMKTFAQTYPDEAFLQQVATKLPWFHHCVLFNKVRDDKKRLWYMHQTIEHAWSRNIVEIQLETGAFQRQGINIDTSLKNCHICQKSTQKLSHSRKWQARENHFPKTGL
jgi:DUF1016 N-terminal domain